MNITLDSSVKAVDFNGQDIAEVIFNGTTVYYKQREMVGTSPMQFKALGLPLKDYKISGNTLQDGTPSPDMPVDVVGCGVRTGNLFDKSATDTSNGYITNGYLSSDGTVYENGAYRTSEYIAVSQNQSYTLVYGNSLNAPSVCFYDASKNFISGIAYGGRRTVPFITPQNATFLRFSFMKSFEDAVMLNLGSTALPYAPYGYKIPLTVNDTEYPIYLGEAQTTRKVKKLVLTGEEDWAANANAAPPNNIMYMTVSDSFANTIPICTHYIGTNTNTWAGLGVEEITVSIFSVGLYRLAINAGTATLTDFKSYLAAQYANGTPVTVWYVLATEETAVVNEPLMKIGDYADTLSMAQAGVTIPTVTGTNTLTVDTTVQPSEVSITGNIKEVSI